MNHTPQLAPLLPTPGVPLIVGFVILLFTVALVAAAAAGRGRLDLPYVATKGLLTPAERAFFLVLQQAAGREYQFFAKVRLADILEVERGVAGKRRWAAFGKISSKHADFVACAPRTFAVRGVIELDDRSHERADRRERDRFFDAAMSRAGVPVLRVAVQRTYAREEVAAAVRSAFGNDE